MKVLNNYNRTVEDIHRYDEKNVMPSLTRPDMSLSIQQIFQRFAQGKPVTGNNVMYDEDDDGNIDMESAVNDPRRMDFVEQSELYDRKKAELDELKGKIDKDAKDKLHKRRKEEIDKQVQLEVEKRLKEQDAQKGGADGKPV